METGPEELQRTPVEEGREHIDRLRSGANLKYIGASICGIVATTGAILGLASAFSSSPENIALFIPAVAFGTRGAYFLRSAHRDDREADILEKEESK